MTPIHLELTLRKQEDHKMKAITLIFIIHSVLFGCKPVNNNGQVTAYRDAKGDNEIEGVSLRPTSFQWKQLNSDLVNMDPWQMALFIMEIDTEKYQYGLDFDDEQFGIIEKIVKTKLLNFYNKHKHLIKKRINMSNSQIEKLYSEYLPYLQLAIAAQVRAKMIKINDVYTKIAFIKEKFPRFKDPSIEQRQKLGQVNKLLLDSKLGQREFYVDLNKSSLKESLGILSNRALLIQIAKEGGILDMREKMQRMVLPQAILGLMITSTVGFYAIGATVAYDRAVNEMHAEIARRVIDGRLEPKVMETIGSYQGYEYGRAFATALIGYGLGIAVVNLPSIYAVVSQGRTLEVIKKGASMLSPAQVKLRLQASYESYKNSQKIYQIMNSDSKHLFGYLRSFYNFNNAKQFEAFNRLMRGYRYTGNEISTSSVKIAGVQSMNIYFKRSGDFTASFFLGWGPKSKAAVDFANLAKSHGAKITMDKFDDLPCFVGFTNPEAFTKFASLIKITN